jgi:uncharacterized membrane protein YjjP (DUF1212 family)
MNKDFMAHMEPDSPQRLTWRMDGVEKSLKEIEKEIEAFEPTIMRYEIQQIRKEQQTVRRALTTLIVGVAGAMVMYLLQKYGDTASAAIGMSW